MENNGASREMKHIQIFREVENLFEAIKQLEELVSEIEGKKNIEEANRNTGRPQEIPSLAEVLGILPNNLITCRTKIVDCIEKLREILF